MRYDDDHYTLSSGRRFYAHGGIIGLGPDDGLEDGLHHGWDGAAEGPDDDGPPDGPEPGPFTPVERREIAAEMMERWREWAGLPDALAEIEKMTDDPETEAGGTRTGPRTMRQDELWALIARVHQKCADVLVFREAPGDHDDRAEDRASVAGSEGEEPGYCDVCKGPCQGH